MIQEIFYELQQLEKEYEKVLLMGDFNATTGGEQIQTYLNFEKGWEAFDETKMYRSSKDKIKNNTGKELLQWGGQLGLKILNGITKGDQKEEFTCFSARGASIVDYVLVSPEMGVHVSDVQPAKPAERCG